MTHKRLYIAAAIIAGVLLCGFIFLVPRAQDDGASLGLDPSAAATPAVSLQDSFKKGVHTITGTVEASRACASVEAEAATTGDPVSGITVALALTEGEGLCLQVPTKLKFSVTLTAPADLPIIATVNDVRATTTIQ